MRKGQFSREFGEMILLYIMGTSLNEAEQYIKDKAKKFYNETHTDAEMYDFIDNIGKMQVDRVKIDGIKVSIGDISGFTQVLCNLSSFYERPQDGIITETIKHKTLDEGMKHFKL